jgi:hypothetical protein
MVKSFPEAGGKAAIALLASVNAVMGRPEYATPTIDLASDAVLKVAERLRADRYKPEDWFRRGDVPDGLDAIRDAPPVAEPASSYLTINLFVLDPFALPRSVGAGGVLFEDPFYALLACYNATLGKPLLLIPFARKGEDLWRRRRDIVLSVREKSYRPERFFAEARPINDDQPGPLKIQSVGGDQLERLRAHGAAVLLLDKARGMAEYHLYFPDLSPP